MTSAVKKAKLVHSMTKRICTHSGPFHADEALAVFMLKVLPEWADAEVIRSRDPTDWDASDIVVDVGARYDGKKFFDHHQRGFEEVFDGNHKTKLSSAGLVYKHFGSQIIRQLLEREITESDLELLRLRVYDHFVESLDANDNGINKYDNESELRSRFKDKAITIPGIVSGMNPDWNGDVSSDNFDRCFQRASKFVGEAFQDLVQGYGNSWLPAKSIVLQAVKARHDVDASGKIVKLPQFCPWKEHVFDIENELGIKGEIEFVLFADSTGTWRISTVPLTPGSFEFRRGLPESLRGLRDEELSQKSGVPGCVFIHAAGFIGGAKSYDSVFKLAKLSYE